MTQNPRSAPCNSHTRNATHRAQFYHIFQSSLVASILRPGLVETWKESSHRLSLQEAWPNQVIPAPRQPHLHILSWVLGWDWDALCITTAHLQSGQDFLVKEKLWKLHSRCMWKEDLNVGPGKLWNIEAGESHLVSQMQQLSNKPVWKSITQPALDQYLEGRRGWKQTF